MTLSFFLSLSLSLNTHKSFWDFPHLLHQQDDSESCQQLWTKSSVLRPAPYPLTLRTGRQAPAHHPIPVVPYLGWWAGLPRTTEVLFFHPGVNPQTGSGPRPFPSYRQCCRRCLKGDTDRLFDSAFFLFGMLFTTRKTDVGASRRSATVTNTVLPTSKQWLKRVRTLPLQYGRRNYGKEQWVIA